MPEGHRWQKFDRLPMPKFLAFSTAATEAAPDADPDNTAVKASSQAFDEGFDEGYRVGLEQAAAESQAQMERWRHLTGELRTARRNAVTTALADVGESLRRVYFAIFRRELQMREGIVEGLVAKLVESLTDDEYSLHVNPRDADWLMERMPDSAVIADDSLVPGSIRAVTQTGFTELHVLDDIEHLLDAAFAEFAVDVE